MGAILIMLCVNGNHLGLCSAQPVQPAPDCLIYRPREGKEVD